MRMGDRTADKGRMQHARQFEVGDELAPAGQQPPVLAPQQRAPDIGSAAFGHFDDFRLIPSWPDLFRGPSAHGLVPWASASSNATEKAWITGTSPVMTIWRAG